MKDETSEKVISLYKFLSEFCKVKQKIITNDRNYLWRCPISSIPNDPDNISILYSDKNTSDEEMDNEPAYLLKVHKPELSDCPMPPECLKKWLLNDDWKNCKKEVKFKNTIENLNYRTSVKTTETINDDSFRKNQLKSWLEKRKKWADEQLLLKKTTDLFTELHKQYMNLKKESEILEIIIANGYIKDSNDSNINHPILTKRLSIDFDAKENTIYVRNTDANSELYSELFQAMKDINIESLSTLNSDLTKHDYHPMDRNETKVFFKKLAHEISADSKFVDDESNDNSIDNRITLYFKPCIIIRERLDGTVKTIEQIIKNIDETGFAPKHLLDIVNGGVLEKIEEPEETDEELIAKAGEESVDILLTKPANKEQLEIAKRIELYNAVLVQGPPGTGKTHTIANLIGHFLAKGNSVLVTSHTSKALSVLKEKLPRSMQSLCVSVLDESNHDMEKSIDSITENMANIKLLEWKKDIDNLKEERLNVINELYKTRRKIYNALDNEYKSIVLNGEEISPLEAAKYVKENRGKLDYINGNIELYVPLPLSIDELNYLYSTNSKISDDEEIELNYKLPNPDDLITPLEFKNIIDDNKVQKDLIKEIATTKGWKINNENDLFFDTEFGEFYINDLDLDAINKLSEFITNYKQYEKWNIICCDGKKGDIYKKKWTTLIKKIKDINKENEKILDKFFGKIITADFKALIENKNSISKLKSKLSKKDKLNKFDLLVNNKLNKIVKLNPVNDKPLQTIEDCDFILKSINLQKSREELAIMWDELMPKVGVAKFSELDEMEPERVAEKYICNIEKNLNWYSNDYNELLTLLKNTKIPEQIVLKINSLDKDINQVNNVFDSIENILPNIIDVCLAQIKLNNNKNTIDNVIAVLEDNLLINSSLCINMKNYLINSDYENYLDEYKELSNIYNKYEFLNKRNELLSKLAKVAPTWADDIKNRSGIHGEDQCPSNIRDAWKYKQYELILDEINKESLDTLQEKSQRLSSIYRKKTEIYASKCAWYKLLKKTECNINMKQALQGWKLTVKKIGRGTGKNATKYKAEARNLMAKCQNAVPCWIMPMSKAIESLKPGENQFDVIIIDEASQSDISSLAIAYFGKKMIVVGDDKQVSPSGVGEEVSKINVLEQTYLKGKIPNSHLYSSKTSLYDIATTTFQPLMLKEHFRCVPEIIGFSNMLSYDFKIKPLRDSRSSNLLPAVVPYRVEGRRIDDINKLEAETIVSQIKACLDLKEYDGKTFGVITMLGNNQGKLIQSLIYKYIELSDIEDRKILVGNASNFQGDERDVVFLSMVDSRNEYGSRLRLTNTDDDKKRYNVATSRAKDQLWIINSLDASSDLKEGDMRKRLLDYANDPKAFAIKVEEIKEKADSIFEIQVAEKLLSEGYNIVQQYPVGAYKLDIVVLCKNKKVAIECDGERYHSGEKKILEDMQRQAILERIGWRFIRIRGSQYFKNPDETMRNVITKLEELKIYPEALNNNEETRTSELLEKVEVLSKKYLESIQQNKETEINYNDILYALDTNKQEETVMN